MKLIDRLKQIINKAPTEQEAIKEMIDEELIVSMSEGRRIVAQLKNGGYKQTKSIEVGRSKWEVKK